MFWTAVTYLVAFLREPGQFFCVEFIGCFFGVILFGIFDESSPLFSSETVSKQANTSEMAYTGVVEDT